MDRGEGESGAQGEKDAEEEDIPAAVAAAGFPIIVGQLDDHAAGPKDPEEPAEHPAHPVREQKLRPPQTQHRQRPDDRDDVGAVDVEDLPYHHLAVR